MYYLNNGGYRWIADDMRFVLVMPDGTRKVRKGDYYYSLGNFAGLAYRVKGQRYRACPKAHDGSATVDLAAQGDKALPHVFHQGGS